MKLLIAAAAGWIAFYTVDQVLYGGRIVTALAKVASAIAAGFGFHF